MTKKLLILAILTIAVTHTHTAYAFDVDYQTDDLGGGIHQLTFHVNDLQPEDLNDGGGNPYEEGNGVCFVLFSNAKDVEDHPGDVNIPSQQYAGPLNSTSMTVQFNSDDIPAYRYDSLYVQWTENESDECTDATALGILEVYFDYDNGIFTVPFPEASSNRTWGSPNGFWGETTPTVVIDDMQASVAETGADIWPLFALLGVSIAFLIALAVINYIKQSAGEPAFAKTDREIRARIIANESNKKKEDFIYHSAEDLEFIREYGQEKKRGRGRPRKNPL